MNLTEDMSFLTLITGASVPVQIVMALLLLTSLISWWYIFLKVFSIRSADKEAEEFERVFWKGGDLNQLYESVTSGRRNVQGMASIFEAGLRNTPG